LPVKARCDSETSGSLLLHRHVCVRPEFLSFPRTADKKAWLLLSPSKKISSSVHRCSIRWPQDFCFHPRLSTVLPQNRSPASLFVPLSPHNQFRPSLAATNNE